MILKGFKAFNNDMTCRGLHFEEGQTYETENAECCESGFHFCENPLDTLNYYNLCESEFAEVEALGEISKRNDSEGTKASTTKIKIGFKLGLSGFIKAGFEYLWEKCKVDDNGENVKASSGNDSKLASSGNISQLASSGNYSQLASSGYYSKLASSGNDSQLASSGYDSQLALNGINNVGAAIGINNKIKGKKGNWITLAEYIWDGENYKPVCVKSLQIDGEIVKEDVWYKLENGVFVAII